MKPLPFLALASLVAVPVLAQTTPAPPFAPPPGSTVPRHVPIPWPLPKPRPVEPPADPQKPLGQVFNLPNKAKMEIVFVVDTTGSMGGLIDGAKKTIWSIVNDISAAQPKPEIKIGFVPYRDKGDAYVTQTYDLTADLDAAFSTLQKFSASGGGDMPEHVSAGLHDAVAKMKWTQGGSADKALYQVIFLVGDCPPHTDYDDGLDYKGEVDKAAQKGIFVNAIRCGNNSDTEKVWMEISKKGNGSYFSLAQTGGVVEISTPYDDEMVKLGAELETTTIARRGMEGARRESLASGGFTHFAVGPTFGGGAAPSASEMEADVTSGAVYARGGKSNYIARQSFNAKSGQIYAAFDLVTDVVNGRKIADIKEDEWPEDLKKKPLAERRTLLEQKVAQRKAIQAKLTALETKRSAFLRAEAEKTGAKDGFDQKLMGAMRSQAGGRGGFTFGTGK
jgi:Mg-chelatase subunit ChlD